MSHAPKHILPLCGLLLFTTCLSAQIRPGGGYSLDRDIIPQDSSRVVTPTPGPQTSRATTYITLTAERGWTNSDGKSLQGKLIAFEDMVIEVPAGETPEPPKPPAHPTVVKDGKVRLLINKKTFVLPLEKLSAADQEEIRKIESAHARKTPAQP